MATRTLNGTLAGPASGSSVANVRIIFTLVDENFRPTDAFDGAGNSVAGTYQVTSANDGTFTVALVPTATGTYYRCEVIRFGSSVIIAPFPAGDLSPMTFATWAAGRIN